MTNGRVTAAGVQGTATAAAPAHRKTGPRPARAFSLVEILVVILIIGIVLSIVFPALSGARNSARRAATTALLSQLSSASGAFYLDNNAMPGYFSPAQMGDAANGTATYGSNSRGFTSMHNVMLDLAGGIVDAQSADTITVGPVNNATVFVDPGRIGAQQRVNGATRAAYFVPDAKQYRSLYGGPAALAAREGRIADDAGNQQLPDLVDSFGMPVLAWTENEGVAENAPFAAINHAPNARAKFYWAQNAPFLLSMSLGRSNAQASNDFGRNMSLLSPGHDAESITATMAALLGNPNFPGRTVNGNNIPTVSRGKLIFHSAGVNGVFLGTQEIGGAQATGSDSARRVQWTQGTDRLTNFDDLTLSAGQ